MEFRICFVYSVSYVLAFAIIPSKANYDAQLAMKMKEMDMGFEEARVMENKPVPMLKLKSDNKLNRPPQDKKIRRQSSTEIHPSSEDYKETTRNKKAVYTLATRKIIPTAAFDDYTPRYRPITVKRPKIGFSRATGRWSKLPVTIKHPKEDDSGIHDRTLIHDETSPMGYIPGIEKFPNKDDSESNEIVPNKKKAVYNIPTISSRWSNKPRKIPIPILLSKQPRKIPTPNERWSKQPQKIPTPNERWSKKSRKIPTGPSTVYKQPPTPYYTTKRLWTSPFIMTFKPTAKQFPHLVPKNADKEQLQDIEDAEPNDDAGSVPNEEDKEPDDDAGSVPNEEDEEPDDDTGSFLNEEDEELDDDAGSISYGEDEEPDDDSGSVPNEEDGEPEDDVRYRQELYEEDPDVSVESEPLAVPRVTRCTTSKPLPKLDPNYLPKEFKPLRPEGNQEDTLSDLKKYRAPNVVEPPHNYIDDE